MGLFNFINYSKEGPGVSKNEPKKKTFIRFFEIYFRNFWKLCTMNLYYVLLSIPVLTYGLGEVGLANVTRNIAREKHSFGTQDFFDTIKKNWKQGLVIGIFNLIITALLIFDVWYFYSSKGTLATILVGNNLVNILASSLATVIAVEKFGEDKGSLIATIRGIPILINGSSSLIKNGLLK